MFGEIQKIFDRNFIVGYLLPSAAFLAFCLDVTHGDDLKAVWGFPDYIGFILLAFGLGIVLLGANRTITRILEGYDRANPLRILTPLQRLRLRRLQRRRALLDAQYTHATERGGQIPESVEKARIEVMVRLAERYPDDEKWLLPSAFGNVMRACEIYPRVMYGLEIVEGWPRLLAVVPKDHQQLLETAKADTDLWVNVWFLSLLTIVDLLATSIHREWCIIHSLFSLTYQRPSARMIFDQFLLMTTPNDWPVWLACLGTFVVGLFGSWMAAKAAIGWGALLKSTTDVFLADLYGKLGFNTTTSDKVARANWVGFSQAIIYRIPAAMPPRNWPGKSATNTEDSSEGKSAEHQGTRVTLVGGSVVDGRLMAIDSELEECIRLYRLFKTMNRIEPRK